MVEASFATAVRTLCSYFERKDPAPHALSLWYDSVRKIPDEAVDWIVDKIKGEDTFPRNLVKMFWLNYHQWLNDNPEKRSTKKEFSYQCADCDNTGFLFVKREGGNRTVFRCKCGRASETGIPIADIRELVSQGWQ